MCVFCTNNVYNSDVFPKKIQYFPYKSHVVLNPKTENMCVFCTYNVYNSDVFPKKFQYFPYKSHAILNPKTKSVRKSFLEVR